MGIINSVMGSNREVLGTNAQDIKTIFSHSKYYFFPL